MIRAAAAALLLSAAASPAVATEWIDCADPDMNARVSLLVGALDVLAVVAAKLDVGDSHWVSDPVYAEGEGTMLLAVGQAFEDAETIRVDLMDDGMSEKLAELRLFKAEDGDTVVYSGTLRSPGRGAWAVSCSP